MSRKNTEAWNSICSMCRMDNIDEKEMFKKAKMLLSIYRRVCWSTIGRADLIADEMCYYCGSDLDGALIYLEQFAPDKEKDRFESRIRALFETRLMIELVDSAMMKVKEFPENGDLYFEILSKCYLSKFKYTENELLEILNIERSRFYDRKKESIILFGLSLWGSSIPKLKSFLVDDEEKDFYG